ncbi:MAG: hypothetical protein LBK12_03085 [Odoribacteraceae bacterium]|jgi:hypothetical protein|nr:hypothetical protein [Odoribacteraceae bacterium]
MTRIFLLLTLCLAALPGAARDSLDMSKRDKVSRELSAMSDSRAITTLKSRALLLAYLEEDDREGAAEVLRFIEEELEEGPRAALTPREKLLAFYRVGSYDDVFRYLNYLDTLSATLRVTRPPGADDLEERLTRYFVMFRESRLAGIRCTDLPADEQEALCIWLDFLMLGTDPAVSRQEINAACNRFLATWAGSPLEHLVRRARVEWEKSPVGLEMSIGMPYFTYSGEIARYTASYVGFSAEMNVLVRRWFVGLDISATPFELRRDRSYSGGKTWKRSEKATLSRVNLQAGYALFSGKHHALTPGISLGVCTIYPSREAIKENKELKEAEATSFQYGAGLQYDLRIASWRSKSSGEFNTHGFRFQYALSHTTSSKRQLSGLTHKFNISYFIAVHGSRRKK